MRSVFLFYDCLSFFWICYDVWVVDIYFLKSQYNKKEVEPVDLLGPSQPQPGGIF